MFPIDNPLPATPFRIENIQPILSISDMERSKAFYIGILGFQEAGWGTAEFTSISRDGCGIYLCTGYQGYRGTWIWIGFDGDLIALHDELKSRGAIIRQAPLNYSWAFEMHVEDPDGHILRFGTDPKMDEPFVDERIVGSY